MKPRRYRLGQRQAAVDQTRARILTAAREQLAASGGFAGLTIDALASQAGVARMTIYYQFGSKVGLLEALCDSLAASGGLEQLPAAFQQSQSLVALDELIKVFAGFWAAHRPVTRRLHGLAALDPDFEQVIRARQERRREGLRVIVRRLMAEHGRPAPEGFDESVDVLHALTSFETFDALAGTARGPEEVAPLIQRLARAAVGLDGNQPSERTSCS
jgi:AcrR family transcriptional regulator